MKDMSGVLTALVTPFRDGDIDESSLRRLVQWQMQEGVQGFVVLGTTAESPCLREAERERIFRIVQEEVAGRLPLVVGTGSNCTEQTITWTQQAQAWGADAALVVVPYYNKPPQRGLLAHFRAVADAVKIPTIVYNVPGRTVTKLELPTVVELSQHQNILGIKESTGDLEFGAAIRKQARAGFKIWSGDDGTTIDLILGGADGVISVLSHLIPRTFARLCQEARQGDHTASARFQKFSHLTELLFVEGSPIAVKAGLFAMGKLASAELRLPLLQAPLAAQEPLLSEMHSLELIR